MPAGADVKFSKELSSDERRAWQTLYPHLKFDSISDGAVTDIDGIAVTALKNDHLASNRSFPLR
jgi:hypothetical protein